MKYDEESIILEEDDGFQLVDPQRDFVPGSVLLHNVADAISRSRRMIMLLSRLFDVNPLPDPREPLWVQCFQFHAFLRGKWPK